MAGDAWDLAMKVVVPLVAAVGTGVGGWFLSAARHGARIKTLEAACAALQAAHALLVTAKDFEHATEKLVAELKTLREDVEELTALLDRVDDSSHDLASQATLASYITENNERWQQMARLVGKIEGMLDVMDREPQRPPRLRR